MWWSKRLPWRFVLGRLARSHGFLDPVSVLARLRSFAQPSVVSEPAIHPRTGGSCMGDGHHVWAAAEWIVMMRNSFLREEGETLTLGAGIPDSWIEAATPLSFGPAPTTFGTVTVHLLGKTPGSVEIFWEGDWHRRPAEIKVCLPGRRPVYSSATANNLRVEAMT